MTVKDGDKDDALLLGAIQVERDVGADARMDRVIIRFQVRARGQ